MKKNKIRSYSLLLIFINICLLLVLYTNGTAKAGIQTTRWENPIRIPAPDLTDSQYPDLAIDIEGNVHVFWEELDRSGGTPNYAVYYSVWDGRQWAQYNDIVPPAAVQPSISAEADQGDLIHLLFNGEPGNSVFIVDAEQQNAFSAMQWSSPFPLNDFSSTRFSNIAVHEETVHVVYDDRGGNSPDCPGCSDIYYRVSYDRGVNWSAPVTLFSTNDGSTNPDIEIDSEGNVFVSWDEGYDNFSRIGAPESGVFMYWNAAEDQWSGATFIQFPNSNNLQTTVGTNNHGGVMLVWRTASPDQPGIYYMWSNDYGKNWTIPQTIQNLNSVQALDYEDGFDMATDSSGNIHLLVAATVNTGRTAVDPESSSELPQQQSQEEGELAGSNSIPGIYHLEWNGQRWSSPYPIYLGTWIPVSPKLKIQNGNRLHAVWHNMDPSVRSSQHSEIFYVTGQTNSPFVETEFLPTRVPTETPELFTVSQNEIAPTPTIQLDSDNITQAGSSIFNEYDEYLYILFGLIPVIVMVILAMVFKNRRF